MTKKIVYRRDAFTLVEMLVVNPLVPKLCLGTHGYEALLRSQPPRRREAELPERRSQAELGNEGIPERRSQAELGNEGIAYRRNAFTLVEMLVVIAIILVIAALAAAFAPRVDDNQKLTRAVDNLEQWLLIAKMRAKRDGLSTGLRFVGAPGDAGGTYSQFQYIQQPDPLVGSQLVGSQGGGILQAAAAGTVTFVPGSVDFTLGGLLSPNQWLVQPGDYLEINGGGVYIIGQVSPVSPTNTLLLGAPSLPTPYVTPPIPSAYDKALTIAIPTTNYRIIRQPRILIGEEPVTLPNNYAVVDNPSVTFPGTAIPTCNVALGFSGFPEILFSPTGAVVGTNAGTPTIWISVWDTTMEYFDTNRVGIVGVQSRTGFLGAYGVSAGPNPLAFVQTARESGL